MKSNCKTRTSRFLMLAGRILMLAGLLLSGCSGPSQITVTGIGTVQSEVPFLPEGRAPEAPDTGTPADGSADTGVQANETADADAPAKGSAETGETAKGSSEACENAKDSVPSGTEQIAVYVCGAVKKPGVCYLPFGARVCDALEAAGGFTADADSQWLNQAKLLADGEMLIVYTAEETAQMKDQGVLRGDAAPADAQSKAGAAASDAVETPGSGASGEAKINLNTASKEQLMTLPGIGDAKADAIIRYRTETGLFASTEDVMNISGIKNSVYEKIRDRVTV